ncbi:MAG TPA: flavin reductase family protein [Bacteroidales bacterium]|jgi:flavin reductase (DIM6/NTAB) family NADH-FMN oxidoreductase RutF|nr:flavin reductase family protein [Bacteroidales bacterium]
MITCNPATMTSLQLQKLLHGTIMPRPVALASTIDKLGRPNLSPFSFYNVFGTNPGVLVFSPVRRRSDHSFKDTCLNVKEIPEVVINAVSTKMVEQVNLAGCEFDRGVNEFLKAGLTPLPSELVKPFRVMESPVQFECSVKQVIETGKRGGAGNLVICEVLLVHVSASVLDSHGQPDPNKLDLVARMGGDYYIRASGKALFKVGRAKDKFCIGVDALPEEVRMSSVLTGNDLGRLGGCEKLPEAPEVLEVIKSDIFNKWIARSESKREMFTEIVHNAARELIGRNEVYEALKMLVAAARVEL